MDEQSTLYMVGKMQGISQLTGEFKGLSARQSVNEIQISLGSV